MTRAKDGLIIARFALREKKRARVTLSARWGEGKEECAHAREGQGGRERESVLSFALFPSALSIAFSNYSTRVYDLVCAPRSVNGATRGTSTDRIWHAVVWKRDIQDNSYLASPCTFPSFVVSLPSTLFEPPRGSTVYPAG